MQVQNIQRPALFTDFLNEMLIWNNEYLTYIQTCIRNVTSTLRKTAKTPINNIKKSLKKRNIRRAVYVDTRVPYPFPERTGKNIFDSINRNHITST